MNIDSLPREIFATIGTFFLDPADYFNLKSAGREIHSVMSERFPVIARAACLMDALNIYRPRIHRFEIISPLTDSTVGSLLSSVFGKALVESFVNRYSPEELESVLSESIRAQLISLLIRQRRFEVIEKLGLGVFNSEMAGYCQKIPILEKLISLGLDMEKFTVPIFLHLLKLPHGYALFSFLRLNYGTYLSKLPAKWYDGCECDRKIIWEMFDIVIDGFLSNKPADQEPEAWLQHLVPPLIAFARRRSEYKLARHLEARMHCIVFNENACIMKTIVLAPKPLQVLKKIFAKGPVDLERVYPENEIHRWDATPLSLASRLCRDEDVIEFLLEKGASCRSDDPYARTSIFALIHNRKFKLAEVMIKNGFDLKSTDGNGDTILHKFMEFPMSDPSPLEFIIKQGVDVDIPNSVNGYSPLIAAVKNRVMFQVSNLIKLQASPDVRDKEGKSASDYAQAQGDAHWLGDRPPFSWGGTIRI
jgi:hypothetical protein